MTRSADRFAAALAALVVVLAVVVAGGAPSARAAAPVGDDAFTWVVTLDGTALEATGDGRVDLPGSGEVRVTMSVENTTEEVLDVRYVRLQGRVLGMDFFVYTTRVDMLVQAGDDDDRDFALDLLDLGRQASGLVPAELTLLDGQGDVVATREFTVDVDGRRLTSVYALFGAAVALATVVLLARALWALARGRLPANRWRRGVTFAAPGLGVGLVATFSTSVAGWVTPQASWWVPLVSGCAALGFAVGYLLLRAPDDEDRDDEDRDDGGGGPQDRVVDVRDSAQGPRIVTLRGLKFTVRKREGARKRR